MGNFDGVDERGVSVEVECQACVYHQATAGEGVQVDADIQGFGRVLHYSKVSDARFTCIISAMTEINSVAFKVPRPTVPTR